MLWFALHLRALPLEAWLAGLDAEAAARPSCVVEARRGVQANAAARASGVEAGMSVATAASLAAGLQAFTRDPGREAAQLRRLALALSRYTPQLVVQPDGVLLEVQPSLRLFGGVRALWRAVRTTANTTGGSSPHDVGEDSLRMAAAPTATAASVLARAEPRSAGLRRRPVAERIDALPLAAAAQAWQIEPKLVELLHDVGCRTLGDVRALPRSGAQRRGAAALLDAIARAHGQAPDPQTWFEPPRTFEQGLELAHRADDATTLVFALQRLVQPLAGWLARQWLAATRLTLLLRHETSLRRVQADTVVGLALADPTRDAGQLTLLLRERLQRLALPAPVYAMTLRLDGAVNHAGRAAALWREAGVGGNEDARALFDRLAARLGAERVRRLALVADHPPERAMALVPVHEPVSGEARGGRRGAAPALVLARDPGLAPGSATDLATASASDSSNGPTAPLPPGGVLPGPPRPAWLLPEPQRLAEDPAFGRPLYGGVPLVLATRAERIEAGWFDGQLVSRDYHVAQAADRRALWVFRERRGAQQQWYLHGVFG